MMNKIFSFAALGTIGFSLQAGCSDDGVKKPDLFEPNPECTGAAITALGTGPKAVISDLKIGQAIDGLDLDGDGNPDNKLAGVANLAKGAIEDSFKSYSIILPMEFFDFPAVAADTCVKFAIYLANFSVDTDVDGKKTGIAGGDCNDKLKNVAPNLPEIAGNFRDDNCDGKADEAGAVPSTDALDHDGDGQTIAAGDCDDTNIMIKKGAAEICGDGLDNDCDGVADRSVDVNGNVTACSPFDLAKPASFKLDPLSFTGNDPTIAFKDGTVTTEAGKLVLNAGPSLFAVTIPVADGIALTLKVTGATIKADVSMSATGVALKNGRLAGILDSRTSDTVRGLEVMQIGLTKDNSLLDAEYANLLGPLLALPKKKNKDNSKFTKYPGCLTPDIDVDHDGLEAFCDSNPEDEIKTVDICIDGDGTEIRDGDGGMAQCTEALDKNGKPRFVDGISVAFTFEAVPAAMLSK
jgi:hypothetical protein